MLRNKEQKVRQMFVVSKERTEKLEKGYESAIEPVTDNLTVNNINVEFDVRGPKIYYSMTDGENRLVRVLNIDTQFVRESDEYTKTHSKKFSNAYPGSQMYHSEEEFVEQFYSDLSNL